jgi:hypothetical protein
MSPPSVWSHCSLNQCTHSVAGKQIDVLSAIDLAHAAD